MASAQFSLSAPVRALSNRNFALYTVGNGISLIGMWVQRLAVGWLMWELTESGAWLGALAVAEFVPTLLITPVSGVIADRIDRRSIAVVGQILACIQATVLCVLTLMGFISPAIIIVLTLLVSIVVAFNQTARLTLIPMLVSRDILTSALAISSISFNLARFVGPLIAGVLISRVGVASAFGFNAVSYVTVVLALLAIDMPPQPAAADQNGGIFNDLLEGCRFAWGHTPLAVMLGVIFSGAVLTRSVGELLPGFAGAVFEGDASTLAVLMFSLGIGAIFAGLGLIWKSDVRGLTRLTLWAVFLNALATLAFAATQTLWLAALALAVCGFMQVASGTGSQTLVQLAVEERMRGRILALWSVIARGAPALGALILGTLAERFGFAAPVMVAAALSALIAWIVLRRRASLQAAFETPG